jgi:hypothetical protein
MPTVAEVVARGYPPAYWDKIKAERDEFIAKFNSDPTFKAEAIAKREAYDRERAEDERRQRDERR